ncbi:MAG: retron St85 family RNA-directed DNA polymerase [Parvularcula sp.]|nr:retron St85 family RNA-directed DNA polymerase [Parvularcula sp.]
MLEAGGTTELDAAREFVTKQGRPYIGSLLHLASYLQIEESLLRQILHRPIYHYRTFEMEQRNGKRRIIQTPRTYLKVVQWWIYDNVLSTVELSDEVHGFRRGRSYVSNAAAHLGAKHILSVDIKDFFPSIKDEHVTQVFHNLGYSMEASSMLARFCCLHGQAPTGAPTSPMIGNLVLKRLDADLSARARMIGACYTRYADDLTFSSPDYIETKFLDDVRSIVRANDFRLNDSKTKFLGRGQRMEVTGLTVNGVLRATRSWRNSTRGLLHRATRDENFRIQNLHRIIGVYGVLKAFDPEESERLTKTAKQLAQRR